MSEPRVALLVHAGSGVGLGHLRRCRALGRALAALGARPVLVVDADEPGAAEAARLAGDGLPPLLLPWARDLGAARDAVERTGAEALVVDSYRATPDLLAGLRPSVGCLAVVDDLADRQLDADLVVNGAVGAAGLPYQAREGTRLLLGPRYALLDPDFADPPAGEGGDRVDRALVALGGGLHAGALRVALTALDGALEGATLDVIVGPFADAAPLGSLVSRNRMAVHRAVADPRPLMLAADLAVSGGGVTLLELAATATPAVAVVLADNQAPGVEGLVRAGAVRSAGRASDPHLAARLSREVHALATDPEERGELGRRARALVDGRGASRAARAVLDALAAVRAAAC